MWQATSLQKVRIEEITGRGRGIVSTEPLRAGEILLTDSPILLYPAIPLLPPPIANNNNYCSHCFKLAQANSCSCSSSFCSSDCHSAALSSSHTPWVCQALTRLRDTTTNSLLFDKDRQIQSRFLIAAYNLALVCPSNFQILLSVQGDHHSADVDTSLFLHTLISSVCPPPNQTQIGFSVELTAALLAKDKLNAFGLMEPFAPDKERSVRAYGIYPMASFFNHDCLPNACRFDYVDSTAAPGNTNFFIRAIHDVPQGREICLSYFPVNLNYSDRQRRLKEDYGFTCDCDRCKVEANWSDDEGDGMEDEEQAAMDEDEEEDEDEDNGNEPLKITNEAESSDAIKTDSDFPHAYFFIRYMCNKDNCFGTLAPLPPSRTTSSLAVMECNVCGNLSNSDELPDDNALEKQ